MSEIMRPILEIAVIIPGMLLAYLPVKACLRQAPFKLGLWMFPLLLGISLSGGIVCYYFQIMTTLFLIPVLLFSCCFIIKLFRSPFGNPVVFFWQSVLFLRA